MGSLYRPVLLAAMITAAAGASAEAQQTATLTVTARVVESCVITSERKRELARLIRERGRNDILQHCSKGVVSRVDARTVSQPVLQPVTPLPRRIDMRRLARAARAGSDVVLTTVTY